MLRRSVERLFDKGCFVLIPTDAKEQPRKSWTIRITTSDSLHHLVGKRERPLADFEGETLEFKNDNRPASRFLYYHFITTLSLARRNRKHGWERVVSDLPTGRPFATPGRYMRDSMLLALAADAGDLSEDEYTRLLGAPDLETFDEKEKLEDVEEAEIARRVLEARSGKDKEEDEEVEDEDDDDDEA